MVPVFPHVLEYLSIILLCFSYRSLPVRYGTSYRCLERVFPLFPVFPFPFWIWYNFTFDFLYQYSIPIVRSCTKIQSFLIPVTVPFLDNIGTVLVPIFNSNDYEFLCCGLIINSREFSCLPYVGKYQCLIYQYVFTYVRTCIYIFFLNNIVQVCSNIPSHICSHV